MLIFCGKCHGEFKTPEAFKNHSCYFEAMRKLACQ